MTPPSRSRLIWQGLPLAAGSRQWIEQGQERAVERDLPGLLRSQRGRNICRQYNFWSARVPHTFARHHPDPGVAQQAKSLFRGDKPGGKQKLLESIFRRLLRHQTMRASIHRLGNGLTLSAVIGVMAGHPKDKFKHS